MKRKYYKNESSTDATKIVIDFICPNTKESITMEIQDSQLAGAHSNTSSMVSARIICEKCKKIHYISLK